MGYLSVAITLLIFTIILMLNSYGHNHSYLWTENWVSKKFNKLLNVTKVVAGHVNPDLSEAKLIQALSGYLVYIW